MQQKRIPHRGRPKKLDRDLILQSAMMAYWSKGPSNVSINDICKLTGASKPSVYREFESDDGLKRSVLKAYQALAIQPLIDILDTDQPVSDTMDAAINFMTQDRGSLGIPDGCLYVIMGAQSDQLGTSTHSELRKIRAEILAAYSAWVERAKLQGQFADIPTDIAALFLETQHVGAMRMQREGVSTETVANVLRVGFQAAFWGTSAVLR